MIDDTTIDIRPAHLPEHSIVLMRAQACQDDAPEMIALCDVALGRVPDELDLKRLEPGAADSMIRLSRRDAILLLAKHTCTIPQRGGVQ
jgi:hypothetical protein